MTTQIKTHAAAAATLAGLVLLVGGCGPEVAVFDKPAIDGIHKLLVMPLQSVQDPSVGPVASGMISMQLQSARLSKFSVIEAPALWRLAAASQPGVQGPADETAVRIARQMGADAVLIGSATYAAVAAAAENVPRTMGDAAKSLEYQKDFAPRRAGLTVMVRVLAVQTGKPVYVHTATKSDVYTSQLLADTAAAALKPLEQELRSSPQR